VPRGEVSVTGSVVTPGGDWTLEFPGQRPPFAPGHLVSLKHGANSLRLVGPLAESIAAEQIERRDCPASLRDPSYASAVAAWAHAEAECRLLRAEAGPAGRDGRR
jgi:hypothetical protein